MNCESSQAWVRSRTCEGEEEEVGILETPMVRPLETSMLRVSCNAVGKCSGERESWTGGQNVEGENGTRVDGSQRLCGGIERMEKAGAEERRDLEEERGGEKHAVQGQLVASGETCHQKFTSSKSVAYL